MIGLRIGELARRADCTVAAIRFYEEKGLLGKADRTSNGRRMFGTEDVNRLTFIRNCRDGGMGLDDISRLLAMLDQTVQPCEEAKAVVEERLQDILHKISDLQRTAKMLEKIVKACDPNCCGTKPLDCTIFETFQTSKTGH
jgi:MerR family transcriptional regulator, copper efflux regulator